MRRILLAVYHSPLIRWAFIVLAVGLAAVAIFTNRHQLGTALQQMAASAAVTASIATVVFAFCTFMAWRTLLADLGSRLPLHASFGIFGTSQLGKYIPGGVWNVIAGAEIGKTYRVPPKRTAISMILALLITLVTGGLVGALTLPFMAVADLATWAWTVPLCLLFLIMLLPPVMNRLIALILRITRREPLGQELHWRGLGLSVLWTVLAWLSVGFQVWLLGYGLGVHATSRSLALSIGGYALAWVIGLLVVFAPAGAGVRDTVLLIALRSTAPHATVLLIVLASRVLLTVVDLLAAAGAAIVLSRMRLRNRNSSALLPPPSPSE